MKYTKVFSKLICITLVVITILTFLPTPLLTFAAEGEENIVNVKENDTVAENMPIVSVSDSYGAPGSEIELALTIENNPGISNAKIVLNAGAELQLIGIERGDAFSDMYFTPPGKPSGAASYTLPCNFLWDSGPGEDTADGLLLKLKFKISENAVPGQKIAVDLSCKSGDFTDVNLDTIHITLCDSIVRILGYRPGDVNEDDRINGTDVTLLRRYIAGGYGAVINEEAGDVNGDGNLNGTDVALIRRYITGGYNVILKPGVCAHILEATAAKEPTCTEAGNIAYWYCDACGRYFDDETAANEIVQLETQLPTTEHTIVIDEAVAPDYDHTGLTEGSHCKQCGTVIIKQEIIKKFEPTYHSIVYKNLNGAESPAETQYAEHKGLLDMPEPVVPGYKFVGWYTQSVGGNIVDYIPEGSTKNYVLFARWELKNYTITYKNAPKNANPTTYTVEDEITLVSPEWSGLIFARWTDKNGETISKITRGTTGNIELEANWNYAKNLAVSNPNKYDYVGGMMDSKSRYYFIYDIGTIENIVLATQYVQKYDGSTNVNREQAVTYRVQLSEAQSASQAVANSVIKSSEWENVTEFVKSHQEGSEFGAKYCPEIEIEGIKAKAYEFSAGWSEIDKDSFTETNVQIDSREDGTEITNQTTSSLSFVTENETTSTVNVQLSKDISPVGVYSYVRAADVKV